MFHNSLGMKYTLFPNDTGGTTVATGAKSLEVSATVDTMAKAWLDWRIRGLKVQDAFPFLRAEEREFLMTGMTPEEWKVMFPPEDEIP